MALLKVELRHGLTRYGPFGEPPRAATVARALVLNSSIAVARIVGNQ